MIYVIFGPTGSGKTDVAIQLAHFLHAPIINADAFQIYKEMNIGTNKISKDDPDYSIHYLLDIKNPNETYSVKEYQDDFRKTFEILKKDYKDIIVCGGTGLYIKAALYDYSFIDEKEEDDDYDGISNEELYKRLQKVDLKSAETIHVNNRKRLIRALNIFDKHSCSKTDIISNQEHKLFYNDEIKFIFLNPNREELYNNINFRVETMMKNGLIEEVKNLIEKYPFSQTARQGIGYKEVIDYLNGNCSLDDCVKLIQQRTRNYAKRQVTFFKNQFKYEEFATKNEILRSFIDGK